MKKKLHLLIIIFLAIPFLSPAQKDTTGSQMAEFQKLHKQSEQIRISDSIRKSELLQQLKSLNLNEKLKKEKLLSEFKKLETKDSLRRVEMVERVESLRKTAVGYPVTLFSDTLFYIYTKIGASTPADRAVNISNRLKKLYYDNSFFRNDSLFTEESDNSVDIMYGEMIIMSISDLDALWNYKSKQVLAKEYEDLISTAILDKHKENSFSKLMIRIGLVILVIAGIGILIWGISKGHFKTKLYIESRKGKWLKDFSYKNYTLISVEQELAVIQFVLKVIKWILIPLLLYLLLPIVFSIFPITRGWAGRLFGLIWSPFKGVIVGLWNYLPNLFSILVIIVVIKFFIRFFRYVFSEIESEKLRIAGFYPDWAMPTFNIVRFLLYAFMFVLVFPYLPGSDSGIFKGVSIFVGVLFSLGSSTAIANMIAGLVITYMRPFKIGDRIKIGEIIGDVVEKTLLVTRLRTIKNEEITIPNSSILSGNTINYSILSISEGLIIHSTVSIGYDTPWREIHQALTEAALKTQFISAEPTPFVLQTSLDDFYVSYQINAYTKESNKQALIYSELHKNIQDVCNEKDIEIMSPHYNAIRDGNKITIPS